MNEYSDGFPDRKTRVSRFKIAALIGIPLAAILFQVYVPRFFPVPFVSGIAAAGDGVFSG